MLRRPCHGGTFVKGGDVLVDGGAAHSKQAGDGGDRVERVGHEVAGLADLLVGHRRGAAEALPSGAGGVQALVGAFDNEFPDELGERGEDVEDQASARGRGVQALVQGGEADTARPPWR